MYFYLPNITDPMYVPAWGLGVGLTTPHRKKQACYETKREAYKEAIHILIYYLPIQVYH
jgi:hypothetical protein